MDHKVFNWLKPLFVAKETQSSTVKFWEILIQSKDYSVGCVSQGVWEYL